MFTGIIEETGLVKQTGTRLQIACALVLTDLSIGGSVAVNGVCLTAVAVQPDGFAADLAPETLNRSNLGDLRAGSRVNLERPVTLQQRLSGHLVQGHVDAAGVVESLSRLPDGSWWLRAVLPRELMRYVVEKGSIALDGISLTVAALEEDVISVAIIPHTYEHTSLKGKAGGERINVECDVLAKHVERLLLWNERLPRPA
ncbi:MAG: riboflavin synthase [Acidobacteriota bacterium]|nr:riboflavin synthase [Acidobacteriota bacterium]